MSDRYRILITTDSICDLPMELIKKLPIAVIPCYVNTVDGRFVDGTEISASDLIHFLRDANNTASSEMPSVSDYRRFFKEKLKISEHLIHISMGKNESKGYAMASEAAKGLSGVTVLDSGQISSGLGLVVRKAAVLVAQGKGYEEICGEVAVFRKLVSSSFIVCDLELLGRSGRVSRLTRDVCDRMLLHPRFVMRNSKLYARGIFAGRWENVIQSYVKKQFQFPWRVDTEILFITHVGLEPELLEMIQDEVKKYVQFEKVYICRATSAITCNCGQGTFGLLFARKGKEKKEKEQKWDFIQRAKEFRGVLKELVANDDFPIRQRIMNLILSAALIGGGISGIISLFLGVYESAVVVFIMLAVVYGCLYLSVARRRWKAAGFIICFFANMLIFPVMYFVSGGMRSGMPMWFVLGLLFDWQILAGWVCYLMFGMNLLVMTGCIIWGNLHPEYVADVSAEYMRNDVIQTIIFVVLILGSIYKYQAYVYEEQKKKIQEHEEELLRSNSAKDLFLANMSHEIRSPINGIMGMDTMLLRECGDNKALKEYGRNIMTSSQTLLSLVNDILDVSKIEAGRFEITLAEYNIFSVVNDCYQIAHSRSVAKGLEFELFFNPAIPSGLYGDEVRICQVVNNLLSNAVKYTEKGTVHMSVDMEKRGDAMVDLVFSVRDTGIGIREEDLGKIFQSFSRVDEKRNRKIEGTGLGLNLTKNLVELMHGDIRVDSVYGQGSTFTVRLPQQIRDRRPAGDFAKKYKEWLLQQEEEVEVLHTMDVSALVIDDVPMNLLVAKGLLGYTGIEVDTAESGKQALSMVRAKKYDIIFMDHVMPEMDGIACLHRMKELPNNLNQLTPVIVLTANAINGIREEYIRTGFKDYLSKPIRERELYGILQKYLPEEKLISGEEWEKKTNKEESTNPIEPETGKLLDKEPDMPEDKRQSDREPDMPEDKQDVPERKRNVESAAGVLSMEKLEAIPELDTVCGMKYCMNNEQFYFTVIKEYLKSDKHASLEQALQSEDWEQYRIQVHALKSTSLNIGADELSEEAKTSEMACKAGDYETVRSRHRGLLEKYDHLVEQLK